MTTYYITTAAILSPPNTPGATFGAGFPVAQLFPTAVTGDTISTPVFCKDTAPITCVTVALRANKPSGWASALTLYGSMDGVTGWTALGTNSASIGSYKFIKGIATMGAAGWVGDEGLTFTLNS